MKNIIARLEALEARSGKSLVLCVTFKDGIEREMGVSEFKRLSEAGEIELAYGGDSVRILRGGNRAELGEYVDIITGRLEEILEVPLENRDLSDYE